MADIALSRSSTPPFTRPAWLDHLAHRTQILRRRARRDRYLALTGRSPRRYPWFETLFAGMSGR